MSSGRMESVVTDNLEGFWTTDTVRQTAGLPASWTRGPSSIPLIIVRNKYIAGDWLPDLVIAEQMFQDLASEWWLVEDV